MASCVWASGDVFKPLHTVACHYLSWLSNTPRVCCPLICRNLIIHLTIVDDKRFRGDLILWFRGASRGAWVWLETAARAVSL